MEIFNKYQENMTKLFKKTIETADVESGQRDADESILDTGGLGSIIVERPCEPTPIGLGHLSRIDNGLPMFPPKAGTRYSSHSSLDDYRFQTGFPNSASAIFD